MFTQKPFAHELYVTCFGIIWYPHHYMKKLILLDYIDFLQCLLAMMPLILMDLKIPMVVEVVSRAVGLNLPLLQSDLRPA
jgi:hypothetical protein